MKMLVIDGAGREIASEQVPTPWRAGADGTTEMDAAALASSVRELLEATASAVRLVSSESISAIAIAGMGETGMLIDRDGRATVPAFAWFDPRGRDEAAQFPAEVRAEFSGRTGLPLGAQVSVAKLAHLRSLGTDLNGLRWLNLPEFVATLLGADTALEFSLTSRTGLLDQDTGAPWPAMLAALGIDESFLPPLRDAGTHWGTASSALPDVFADAAITVAGHDHLVAADGSGTLSADHYHVSIGTAEVLLRVVDGPLGFDARQRLAEELINEVRHVTPGKHVLIAGVKTGLLLRRALQAAGISDRRGRDQLDTEVMALPLEGTLPTGAIEASGARNDDGVLSLAFRTDGVSPAEVFGAILRHSNDEIAKLIDAMERELPRANGATLTGGWAGMASVQRARSQVLPEIRVSPREQETAYAAALVAARLARAPVYPSP